MSGTSIGNVVKMHAAEQSCTPEHSREFTCYDERLGTCAHLVLNDKGEAIYFPAAEEKSLSPGWNFLVSLVAALITLCILAVIVSMTIGLIRWMI